MTKRNRSDSISELSKAVANALADIDPPETSNLNEKDMVYWKVIIEARHEWSKIDLFHAANLARTLRMIDEESAELNSEGSVIWGGKNGTTKVMNPRHTVLEQLSRRSALLSQKLQVHTQATMGEPRDNAKKNGLKAKAKETLNGFDDDESSLLGNNLGGNA